MSDFHLGVSFYWLICGSYRSSSIQLPDDLPWPTFRTLIFLSLKYDQHLRVFCLGLAANVKVSSYKANIAHPTN